MYVVVYAFSRLVCIKREAELNLFYAKEHLRLSVLKLNTNARISIIFKRSRNGWLTHISPQQLIRCSDIIFNGSHPWCDPHMLCRLPTDVQPRYK